MAHSRFSPSASKRWMACPGSIQLSESIPFVMDTTIPAATGTLVLHMVEMLLKDRLENVTLSDYWYDRDWETILNFGLLEVVIVIIDNSLPTMKLLNGLKVLKLLNKKL